MSRESEAGLSGSIPDLTSTVIQDQVMLEIDSNEYQVWDENGVRFPGS